MNEVEAVKNRDTIKLISYLLERHFGQQMADVWNIGLNLALRISDLLSIKFSDIDGDRLSVIEQKTGKRASIKLNPKTLALIEAIHQRHPEHIYLFQSHRSSQAKDRQAPAKPLTRRAVAKAFAFAFVGDDIKLAWAPTQCVKHGDITYIKPAKTLAGVMRMLRHQSEAITLRYIGITQQQIDKDFVELEI